MFKKINSKLESIFDRPTQSFIISEEPKSFTDSKSNFHTEDNHQTLENLSYIFANEVDSQTITHFFSSLAPHFEVALLLNRENTNHAFKIIEAFAFAKKINTLKLTTTIKLPASAVYTVLKIKAFDVLSKFNLQTIDPEKKMTAYMISLSENYRLIVITPSAEPWAQIKIESLQKTLMKIGFTL